MKKILAIIILAILVIFESYYIYAKTYSGYMFNPKYNMERVNIDYVLLSYNLLTLKDRMEQDAVMSIFVNDVENKYNVELQYWFNKRNFYPISMPREHNTKKYQLLDYSNKEFSESLIKNKNDYIILVGKNSSILNVTTTKDISFYKVINGVQLELLYEFDNTLYDLQKNTKENHAEYFEETMRFIQAYLKNYSNEYSIAAYEYLYEYIEAIQKENPNLARSYYAQYLTINTLDPVVLLNKAQIYQYMGDSENAKFMVSYCETLDTCDIERANKIKNSMEVVK